MSRKLVMYYSLEGNTRFIARAIAEAIGADILEIKPQKAIDSHSFRKYIWGGMQVILKEKPALLPFQKEPRDYDIIFLGTPVWAGCFSSPLRSVFSRVNFQGKKVALFCCHRGGKGNIFAKMKKNLAGATILGEIDFNRPLQNNTEASKHQAQTWAREIIAGIEK